MYPPPELRTSNAELLGTTAGIIITAIVASAGLAVMVGMVFWANAHPGYKRPGQPPRPQQRTAEPAVNEKQRISIQPQSQDQHDGSADGASHHETATASTATKPAMHQPGRP